MILSQVIQYHRDTGHKSNVNMFKRRVARRLKAAAADMR